MEFKFDKTVCSDQQKDTGYFQIASGHISETVILFEKENVVARVQAKGQAAFYDLNGQLLASAEVPAAGGREVYEELCCQMEEGKIVLLFPIYEWIDNYPNCDGEYDRWESRRVGSHSVIFDLNTKKVL